jgi:catechol 2,3-dioxygenase-like lactoylglutathione lyase family enzyme
VSTFPSGLSAITLFFEDLAAAKEFYRRVFALEPVFEDDQSAAFAFGTTIINVLVASSAPELIEPARVAAPHAGTRDQLTITVDDADATCARLRERGVTLLNGPIDRPWGVRTAAFADPGGHVWEIAQPIVGS